MKIKSMPIEKYLRNGSDTPDLWAKSKRMDFIEVKDLERVIKELKEAIYNNHPLWDDITTERDFRVEHIKEEIDKAFALKDDSHGGK